MACSMACDWSGLSSKPTPPRKCCCAPWSCAVSITNTAPTRDQLVANALFADGAAALVAGAAEKTDDHWQIAATASLLLPDCEEAMTWRIGNHGFEMTLSPRVPELIARYLRPWLEAWLKAEGLSLAAIGSWAIHPGGPRIIESVAAALDLPASATVAQDDQNQPDHYEWSHPLVSNTPLAEHDGETAPLIYCSGHFLPSTAAPIISATPAKHSQ